MAVCFTPTHTNSPFITANTKHRNTGSNNYTQFIYTRCMCTKIIISHSSYFTPSSQLPVNRRYDRGMLQKHYFKQTKTDAGEFQSDTPTLSRLLIGSFSCRYRRYTFLLCHHKSFCCLVHVDACTHTRKRQLLPLCCRLTSNCRSCTLHVSHVNSVNSHTAPLLEPKQVHVIIHTKITPCTGT